VGVSMILITFRGPKSPKTPFWGPEEAFQAKYAKHSNITNTTLQYAALDILAQGSYVRSYLCFFCLNKVIFAVFDVSSLPLQKCQTSMAVFFLVWW